jgi:cytochrome c-type biogenesis protein CcmH/NrfG
MGVPSGTYVVKVVDLYGNVLTREFVNVSGVSPPVTLRLPERKQETAKAETISIQRLAHQVPKAARKEFERAAKAARKNQADQCIAHLRKAVELDPEYFEAHVNLGVRLIRSGNAAGALTAFEQALRLDETHSILYSNTSTALLMLKRAGEAERAARRAVELDPLNARARYMLGVSLLEQNKQIAEAVSTLQSVCDAFPYARVALAQTLAAQGKRQEAVVMLQAYLDSGRMENREQVQTWITSLNQIP